MRGSGLKSTVLLVLGFALLAPSGAVSESDPQGSFDRFAAKWIREMNDEGERARTAGGAAQFTYRSVGEDFSTRLKSTGDAQAPYVGILSYVETVFACRAPSICEMVESSPVTEIFPFQGGRWKY